MTRESCIGEMNRLGGLNVPFCFLIDFEERMPRVWRMDTPSSEFHFDFNGLTNTPDLSGRKMSTEALQFSKYPISLAAYQKMFDQTRSYILKGDSYLVNLTAVTRTESNLELTEIYHRGVSRYKCMLQDRFVSFSPETFIQIDAGRIRSFPMKGTIDATLQDACNRIMLDEKEAAEHATIVDLIRNDLSKVATDVRVDRYRYYETISNNQGKLGQVSSEISGRLPVDYQRRIGDIIFRMLPAGSVSGAPKERTLEIIRATEEAPRGYYTGIAGLFEDGKLDSCVLIRFLESNGAYHSGGGITQGSTVESEFREMIDKVYVPIH